MNKAQILENQLVKFLAALWFVGVLSVFIFYPPYWALMDDASHLNEASAGFFKLPLTWWVSHFVKDDFGWGMFRPMYAVFIYLFYGPFSNSPALGYFVLALVNFSIFWIWALLFERSLKCWKPDLKPNSFVIYRYLFFIFCFLFSPNFTLFFFASLQERLVLLFGALAFYGMLELTQNNINWKSIFCVITGVLLALFSKASALFLILPIFLWLLILCMSEEKPIFLWVSLVLICLGIGFGYFFLSIRTGYTSDYKLSLIFSHFFHGGKRFTTPFWFAFATIGVGFFDWRVGKTNDVKKLTAFLSWPLLLLCYLIIMVPWRAAINYYLITPGGMFWTGCKILLCFYLATLFAKKFKYTLLIIILISFGVSIPSAKKFIDSARDHHIAQEAVQFLRNDFQENGTDRLVARMSYPCIEASDAMSFFVGEPKLIQVLETGNSFPREPGKRRLLIVSPECSEIPGGFNSYREIFKHGSWRIYESA